MVFGVQKNEAKGKEHYHCLPKSEGHRRNLPQVRHSPMEKKLHTQSQRNHAGYAFNCGPLGDRKRVPVAY